MKKATSETSGTALVRFTFSLWSFAVKVRVESLRDFRLVTAMARQAPGGQEPPKQPTGTSIPARGQWSARSGTGSGCRPSAGWWATIRLPGNTGIRDYIHVVDLAGASCGPGLLGGQSRLVDRQSWDRGGGYSVLEIVRAFERASGHAVPLEIVARRAGDIATCYADPTLARERLGWSARRDLDAMCRDAWRWQCNPAAC